MIISGSRLEGAVARASLEIPEGSARVLIEPDRWRENP
jgi:hypothetical protein